MLRSLVSVCVLLGVAEADVRYPIHPTNGEFGKTSNPCGKQTQDELFNRVIKFVPTLIVRPVESPGGKGSMILNIDGTDYPNDETVNGEGRWYYYSPNKTQLKTQKVILRPGNKDKPKQRVISISVIRRLDEIECSERWVGSVEGADGQ